MRTIGAFEAKDTLGSLLDHVERGEEVVITRRGRPVARLVREATGVDRAAARQAASDILAASKGVTLGGIALRELIDEGRL
jgi:prevent-host-death family protein